MSRFQISSSHQKATCRSGAVLHRHDLPPSLFGEGTAVFGDRIIQLTWQAGRAFVYDKANFDRLFVTGKWWPKLFEISLAP